MKLILVQPGIQPDGVCHREVSTRYGAALRELTITKKGVLMGLLQLVVTWYMLEGKLPTGISKPKRLHQDKFELSLFWMSQWAACPPACTMWPLAAKGPLEKNIQMELTIALYYGSKDFLVIILVSWALLTKEGLQEQASTMLNMQPLLIRAAAQDPTDPLTYHKLLLPCRTILITHWQVNNLVKAGGRGSNSKTKVTGLGCTWRGKTERLGVSWLGLMFNFTPCLCFLQICIKKNRAKLFFSGIWQW